VGTKCKALLLFSLGLFFLVQAGGICWSQTTERVSLGPGGIEGNNASNAPSISGDGRHVAFKSNATNLVASDGNGFIDIFVHDRQTGETTRVSVDSNGVEANNASTNPSISGDGMHVAFESIADNLVAGDTPFPFGFPDIFVHDLQTGETTRVSVDSTGGEGDGPSFNPSISEDGRYVAFDSDADLVLPDVWGVYEIYVHDLQTGETTRVSVDSTGTQGDNHSYSPSISSDGKFVAFQSDATNLVGVGNDTNGSTDIFVHDLQTGETTRVSVDSTGTQGDNHSYSPSISSDGKFVAFQSDADNLIGVGNDTNGSTDVFVDDRPGGNEETSGSSSSSISGCFIATVASDGGS
jgi:Tol biopolymer transport system component